MDFLVSEEKLGPIVQKIIEETKDQSTINCLVTLKNIDFKKDVRFDSNCLLPHSKRAEEKVCVLADKNLQEVCEANNIPFITFESVQGANIEKKRLKKKICDQYHSFISLPTYNRYFEMRILAARNKPIYIIKNASELLATYQKIQTTLKFKLKKSVNIHFPIAHTGMEREKIVENVSTALLHLFGLLKGGLQNIDTIFMKSTYSPAVKLYGK